MPTRGETPHQSIQIVCLGVTEKVGTLTILCALMQVSSLKGRVSTLGGARERERRLAIYRNDKRAVPAHPSVNNFSSSRKQLPILRRVTILMTEN